MTLFSSLSSTPPKKIEIVLVHYYSGIPPTLFFWLPLLAERVLPSPASPRNGGAEKKGRDDCPGGCDAGADRPGVSQDAGSSAKKWSTKTDEDHGNVSGSPGKDPDWSQHGLAMFSHV